MFVKIIQSTNEGVGALLHVAVFVAVLALTYLRLDHVRAAGSEVKANMKTLRETAHQILQKRGLLTPEHDDENCPVDLKGEVKFETRDVYYPVYALCVMAKRKIVLNIHWRLYYYIARQRDIPFLVFFRSERDAGWALLSLLISTLILFSISASAILHFAFIDQLAFQIVTLSILFLCFLIIVALSAISSFQSQTRLIKACSDLNSLGDRRKAERMDKIRKELEKDAQPNSATALP